MQLQSSRCARLCAVVRILLLIHLYTTNTAVDLICCHCFAAVHGTLQLMHYSFRKDFDWFLLGGDDMFIIVENLRKYVLSKEIQKV